VGSLVPRGLPPRRVVRGVPAARGVAVRLDDEPEEPGPPAEELGPPAEARRRSSASTTSARSPRTPAAEEEGWGDGDEGCGAATADDPNGGGDGAARSGVVRAMR